MEDAMEKRWTVQKIYEKTVRPVLISGLLFTLLWIFSNS